MGPPNPNHLLQRGLGAGSQAVVAVISFMRSVGVSLCQAVL